MIKNNEIVAQPENVEVKNEGLNLCYRICMKKSSRTVKQG